MRKLYPAFRRIQKDFGGTISFTVKDGDKTEIKWERLDDEGRGPQLIMQVLGEMIMESHDPLAAIHSFETTLRQQSTAKLEA